MAETLKQDLRLVKPGDIVVSLREILDKVGPRLTEQEKEDLLLTFLSRRREQVMPGDLITADLFNQILRDILQLNFRLAVLEETSPAETEPPVEPDEPAATILALILDHDLKPFPKVVVGAEEVLGKTPKTYPGKPVSITPRDFLAVGTPEIFCEELERNLKTSKVTMNDLQRLLERLGTKIPVNVMSGLPAGAKPPQRYLLKARAKGYKTASQIVTLAAARRQTVILCLEPAAKPADSGKQGSVVATEAGGGIRDRYGNEYRKVAFPDRFAIIPWDEIWKNWEGPGYVDPLPPDVQNGIEEVLQSFLDEDLELGGVTTGDLRLAINPEYDPQEITDEPYAFVVMGEVTAMPVILTAEDQNLPVEVPVSQAGIPDLSEGGAAAPGLLGSMDILANAWSGLVGSVFGMGSQAAAGLIGEVRVATRKALADGAYLPGLGAEARKDLAGKGYASDRDLANANAGDLKNALGAGYSEAFAARLIEYARKAVPESAWSLRSGSLGLTERHVSDLEKSGSDSLGALERGLEDAATGAKIKGTLGMTDLSFGVFKEAVGVGNATGIVRTAPPGSLRALKTVDRGMAGKLVAAGMGSATDVAAASVEDVAAALGVSADKATEVRNDAVGAVLTNRLGLSEQDANTLTTAIGRDSMTAFIGSDKVNTIGLTEGGLQRVTRGGGALIPGRGRGQ